MKIHVVVFWAFALALSSGAASAALVSIDGRTIQYQFDGDKVGAFGSWALSSSGESLEFVPNDFSASVLGVGLALKNQTLVIAVHAKPGFLLSRAKVYEQGYSQRWAGNADALKNTGVSVSGQFQVGAGRAGFALGESLNQGSIAPQPLNPVPWQFESSLDIDAASSVTISLSNWLFAWGLAPSGGVATIEKTLTTVSVEATAVSLPSSLSLFGIAIMAVILIGPSSARIRS